MTQAEQDEVQSFAFVVCTWLCVLLSVGIVVLSITTSERSCPLRLDDKINPNDAPIASLVRLPGIGGSRAGAIIAYRENFGRKDGESSAFQNCNDLQKVKGIGAKTVQNISEWLKFE